MRTWKPFLLDQAKARDVANKLADAYGWSEAQREIVCQKLDDVGGLERTIDYLFVIGDIQAATDLTQLRPGGQVQGDYDSPLASPVGPYHVKF